MAAKALPPSDTLVPSSVGIATRSYEVVEDVVIEVSMQLKFPNSAYSSPRLSRSRGSSVGAKKKKDDGGQGLNWSKSYGEGRGKALPHGLVGNRIVVGDKCHNKQKEGKTRRCGGQFRCGALCLLLPDFGFRIGKGKRERKEEAGFGFSIGKGKRERKEEGVEVGDDEEGACISISLSRRVSLEKFECGSWASLGMVVHEDGELGTGAGCLYFDLPMELIRNSVDAQTQSPVNAAFVFDRDRKGVHHHVPVWSKPKSAEELGAAAASPCIITPRSRKAREEFNALLEAHTHTL